MALGSSLLVLQNAAAANGNGTATVLADYGGLHVLEIAETNGGTASVSLQGSFDGSNWLAGVGYQQIDATVAPARAVAGISVTANSRHAYVILDSYPQIQAVVSAVAGGANVTVKLYLAP